MSFQSLLQNNGVHPSLMGRSYSRHCDIRRQEGPNGELELFGVEIELEGPGLLERANNISIYKWKAVRDDSLRGEALELVSPGPRTIEQLTQDFAHFADVFRDWDTSGISERCSIHVHYNVSGYSMRELLNMLVAFYLIENAITYRAGGPERQGNKFCLRTVDSETPIKVLTKCFQTMNFWSGLKSKSIGRYSNLNLLALNKFGTLEVRCHKGSANADEIFDWVKVLRNVFFQARTFDKPEDIIIAFSALGPEEFLMTHFPVVYDYVREVPDLDEKMYECLDYAQSLAYCIVEDENGLKKPGASLKIPRKKVVPSGGW
jgi:hypothetical protein